MIGLDTTLRPHPLVVVFALSAGVVGGMIAGAWCTVGLAILGTGQLSGGLIGAGGVGGPLLVLAGLAAGWGRLDVMADGWLHVRTFGRRRSVCLARLVRIELDTRASGGEHGAGTVSVVATLHDADRRRVRLYPDAWSRAKQELRPALQHAADRGAQVWRGDLWGVRSGPTG